MEITIEVVLWLMLVVAMCSLALGLMWGHAIGYRKAEVIGKRNLTLYKLYLRQSGVKTGKE